MSFHHFGQACARRRRTCHQVHRPSAVSPLSDGGGTDGCGELGWPVERGSDCGGELCWIVERYVVMCVGENGERAVRDLLMQRISDIEIEVGIPGAPDDVNRHGEGL